MKLLITEGIEVDVENSIKFNGIFVTEGKFSGLNVSGNFEKTITSFTCQEEGEKNIQVYVNVRTGGVILDDKKVKDSCIPQAFHIGGLVVVCDDCGNYTIKDELLPENPCIAYARPFSSAFGISMNKKKEQYDICSIVVGEIEFNSDYNCDYAIQGTTLPCPEDFALFNGNSGVYIGVDGFPESGLYDGNTPNPNPNPIN